MENIEITLEPPGSTTRTSDSAGMFEFESVTRKMEPMGDGTKNVEDGSTLTTSREEHQVKVEDEHRDDLICGLSLPEPETSDHKQPRGQKDNLMNEVSQRENSGSTFQCQKCPKCYDSRRKLTSHICTAHGEKKHCCEICGKRFVFLTYLKTHLLTHSSEPQFECADCPKKYHNREGLVLHIKSVHQGLTFKCNLCDKVFMHRTTLVKHTRLMHGESQRLGCSLCHKTFRYKHGLLKHMKNIHSGETKYSCDICQQKFRKKQSMEYHKKYGLHTMTLDLADKSRMFESESVTKKMEPMDDGTKNAEDGITLTTSREEHQGKVEDEYRGLPLPEPETSDHEQPCGQKDNLMNEVSQRENSGSTFQCQKCSKCFESRRKLTRHICDIHGEKKHCCEICGKCYKYQPSLKKHLLTHSSEPQFKCADCPKKYLNREGLAFHIKSVHQGLTFKCDLCGKVYMHRATLVNHTRLIHGESQRLQCSLCHKTFRYNHCLLKHMRNVHSGKTKYSCDICQQKFKWKKSMKYHKKYGHHTMPSDSADKSRMFESESVAKKMEPMDDGTKNAEDGATLKTSIEEHQVKLEDEYRDDLICGLPLPEPETSDDEQPRGQKGNLMNAISQRENSGSKFQCQHCSKYFDSQNKLKQHFWGVHAEKKHCCEVCGKHFAYPLMLKKHLLSHSSEPQFECSDCNKKYFNQVGLAFHIKSIHQGLTFKCDLCGKVFMHRATLVKHMRLPHGESQRLECSLCHKTFRYKQRLLNHIKNIHSSKTKYSHTITSDSADESRMFEFESVTIKMEPMDGGTENAEDGATLTTSIEEHQVKLEDEQRDDLICGLPLPEPETSDDEQPRGQKDNLMNEVSQREISGSTFQCQQCSKCFDSKRKLTRHICTVHGEKKHCCEICGNRYKYQPTLETHLLTHSSEPQFECPDCHKKYFHKTGLTSHIKSVHQGLTFKCDLCGEVFLHRTTLEKHARLPHGESQSQKCFLCPKRFRYKQNLLRHIKIIHSWQNKILL